METPNNQTYRKTDSKRYPWVLTVDGYTEFEGIRVPSKMKATWKLDKGDWTWLKLEIVEIQYNENIPQSYFLNRHRK